MGHTPKRKKQVPINCVTVKGLYYSQKKYIGMSPTLQIYQRKCILASVMSITSAIAAIYAEKMVTPKMEAFLNKAIKSRRLTYEEKRAMQTLVNKIKAGEIILLSAQ